MRVKVSEIDNGHATTEQAAKRLFAIIEPAIARGEPVVLDFEGVRHYTGVFFGYSLGPLADADRDDRLRGLLRLENVPPYIPPVVDLVIDNAKHMRDATPRYREAREQALRKIFEEE